MENNYIEINLFRISSDGVYLDLIATSPKDSKFTTIEIETRYLNGNSFASKLYVINLTEEQQVTGELKVRIPVYNVNKGITVNLPMIYKITLKAVDLEGNEIKESGLASDVTRIYQDILDNVLSLSGDCTKVSDEAIRKYMILYGHLSAMVAGDIDIAEMYFKILINNFNKCGTRDGRSCGTCGCSTNYIPSTSHIVDHNCGCGK